MNYGLNWGRGAGQRAEGLPGELCNGSGLTLGSLSCFRGTAPWNSLPCFFPAVQLFPGFHLNLAQVMGHCAGFENEVEDGLKRTACVCFSEWAREIAYLLSH